jgi:LPS-assembly protein
VVRSLVVWFVLSGFGLWGGPAKADPPPLVLPPSASNSTAQSAAPRMSSDLPIEYQEDGKTLIARKNALLETPTFRVEADTISLNQSTGQAEASGNVKLSQKALRVLTRKASYDMGKKQISAEMLRMGKPPLYLEGRSLSGTAENATITDGTLYFNEPDPYGLNIHAGKVEYDATTQEITLHDATFRLGPLPFFYLPVYSQERTDRPPVSVQTKFGFRNDLGAYGQSTTFWTKNPTYAPGILLDFYSKRGILFGPAFKYDYLTDPAWFQSGTLESGYINDQGSRGLDLNNQPIPQNRYFIDWQHKGVINDQFELTNSMYWWSDSYVLRDFRQNQWQNNQLPDNFVEADRREENALISAFVRYRPNDFEVEQQRLPEVRYDLLSTPLWKTGIYQQGQASYVQLEQQSLSGGPTLHSNRFDTYYGFRRPYTPTSWFTVTPLVGGRITSYLDTLNDQGQFTRFLGQAGFDAEMRSYGVWNYSNPTWGINGLRHVLRPVLMYRYIPNAQQGYGKIPVIDQAQFTSYPPIVDLNDTRSVDLLYDTNFIRYGVENTIQTRSTSGNYGSRDLASFNLYNDLQFQRAPGQPAVSNIWASLGFYPADWVHFDIFTRFDPGALTLREIRTRVRFIDGERWAIAVYTDNLQHEIDQYWLEAMYKISERYQLGGRWQYDQRLGYITQQVYSLKQRLGNSWDITYEIAYYRGTSNQNGIGFNIKFDLLAF